MKAMSVSQVIAAVVVLASVAGAEAAMDELGSAAQRLLPSVVIITVASDGEGEDDESLEIGELLGHLPVPARQAVATGIIIEPSGLVLTSAQAISGGTDIAATTADGVSRPVGVVGLDRATDIAVVRIRGGGSYAAARWGDSDAVQVGDVVVAIGTPYGLGASVTRGIVSARPRPTPRAAVDDLLQTDATTFADSAGGPIANVRGEVIGITTLLTLHEFGISFAMPGNTARNIATRLARDGAIVRGSTGARFQELTPGLARALGAPDAAGLLVADAPRESAVARAGLRAGDIVTKIDRRGIARAYDVERILLASAPAQELDVTYWRGDHFATARVVLDRARPMPVARPLATGRSALLRVDVRALTPEMGVVVSLARPDQPPTEPGLRAGDVIRQVNQVPVTTLRDFERVVDRVRPGDWVLFLVQRGAAAIYVAVEARAQSAASSSLSAPFVR